MCELCSVRLSRGGEQRPWGAGRAHQACIKTCIRHVVAAHAPVVRRKRPYEQLGSTQRYKRRKEARGAVAAVLERIGCPAEEVLPIQRTTPAELLHLSTAERVRIRTVPSLHIPSEQTIIKCKQQLASSHATETATFANGAYITDPIRFVAILCMCSSLLVVGGDAGDGLTKLGVTYLQSDGTQAFAALVVFAGSDDFDDLTTLATVGKTPFVHASAGFPHIFAVLQHWIDTHSAFLNGDWPFINAVLGLMSPSATHPCPVCIVGRGNLLAHPRYRVPGDRFSQLPSGTPLLTIDSERVVPTPLHLFLGISNRIILDAFGELFGKPLLEEALKPVKTIHSAGCGGRSDFFDLNGPEVRKWIKRRCCATLLTAAPEVSASTRASHSILTRWLQSLHDHLLHKKTWTGEQLEKWRDAVDDMQAHWREETSQAAFPKLHMLRHALEFAERHRFLGRASEAQIESYHATFKRLFHAHHVNTAHDQPERLRRCLADTTLLAVQSVL